MKRITMAIAICVVPLTTHAYDLGDIFEAARAVNETFLEMQVDAELAELRYQRGRIEAPDELARLNAEATFLAARASRRGSLRDFYREVVDAVYNAVIADYDRRIAELNEDLAIRGEAAAEVRFRNGLIPEGDLLDARIAVRAAAVETEEKTWQWEDALEELDNSTGLTFEQISVPDTPSFAIRLAGADWIDRDPAVARARTAEQIAEVRLERLPENAAPFDRTVLETELDRARLTAERAVNASERTYEMLRRRATTLPEVVTIRTEQLRLSEASRREAQERFDRGLITATQRDQTQIRVLTAQRNLIEAERNFMRIITEYAALSGVGLEEVL